MRRFSFYWTLTRSLSLCKCNTNPQECQHDEVRSDFCSCISVALCYCCCCCCRFWLSDCWLARTHTYTHWWQHGEAPQRLEFSTKKKNATRSSHAHSHVHTNITKNTTRRTYMCVCDITDFFLIYENWTKWRKCSKLIFQHERATCS